jgi:hypothetical protein
MRYGPEVSSAESLGPEQEGGVGGEGWPQRGGRLGCQAAAAMGASSGSGDGEDAAAGEGVGRREK